MSKISVVIPAYNEEKYITNTLLSLQKQKTKDVEIIVVDNNSTDKTAAISKKYAKVIKEKRQGIGIARNSGARIAKGKIIVFLDADTKASPHLINIYSKAFADGVVAATGPILPLEKVSKKMQIGYKIVSIIMIKASIITGKPLLIGSNFAVRTDVFKKIKGFNEKLKTYEDFDLSERLRPQGKIIYIKKAVAYASTRRVQSWGMLKYTIYHFLNAVQYNIKKEAKEDYDAIR
jgi:glycosyltransferase involved in cell wall biosynthesis